MPLESFINLNVAFRFFLVYLNSSGQAFSTFSIVYFLFLFLFCMAVLRCREMFLYSDRQKSVKLN